MFNTPILEVAIGLVFCYASVALITSSIFEAIASWLNLRSNTLLGQIRRLLNADTTEGEKLLLQVYNHALVHPLGSGTATSTKELKKNAPSYIDPRHFASALIDTLQTAQDGAQGLSRAIQALPNVQLQQLLRGMYGRADGDPQRLQQALATWFDAAMDRASGAYKRQSQLWCFVIAFVLSLALNIDSLHLFSTLWKQPALVAQISAPAGAVAPEQAMRDLETLPIGWQNTSGAASKDLCSGIRELLLQFVGWLITASAALFGAPFWFDLLQRLTNLRGSGPKPEKPEQKKDGDPPPAPAPTPARDGPALGTERNAIVDLHAARNKDDPSYRPLEPGERW